MRIVSKRIERKTLARIIKPNAGEIFHSIPLMWRPEIISINWDFIFTCGGTTPILTELRYFSHLSKESWTQTFYTCPCCDKYVIIKRY